MVQPLGSVSMRPAPIGTVTFLVQALRFQGTAWNSSIWDCKSVPNRSAFELGPKWNRARVERFQMGPDRK